MKRFSLLVLFMLLILPAASFAADKQELSVTVNHPASSHSIPRGSQRVLMIELILEASCTSDIPVEGIVIHDRGLGSTNDILRVYAMEGGRRVSNSVSLHSRERSAILRLRKFSLDECGKRKLKIYADFSSDALSGAEHNFSVRGDGDIQADADTTIIFTNDASSVRTAPLAIGKISASMLRLTKSVSFGPSQTIGRLQLSADNQSDHLISAITVTNQGKARDGDLRDLRLKLRNGDVVSEAIQMNGDIMRFEINPPLLLKKGQTRLLTIEAELTAGRRQTIELDIDEPSDIESFVRIQRGASYQ